MARILLSLTLAIAGAFLPLSAAIAESPNIVDTIAGSHTQIPVSGVPSGEKFAVAVFDPEGKKVTTVSGRMGGEDTEFVDIDGEHLGKAGTYSYRIYNKAGREEQRGAFMVFAGPLAQTTPFVESEDERKKTVCARFTDDRGNAIRGSVPLLIAHGGEEVERIDNETGKDGTACFLVFTSEPSAVFTLVDTLSESSWKHEVVFDDLSPQRQVASPLRASLLEEFGKEDEEGVEQRYGYVDHFDVQIKEGGMPRKIVGINQQLDFVITALDGEGRRVKDYVGDVGFETTDPNALAPLQSLRFLPSHKGLLERTLALMFSSPALRHTVRVYDKEAPEIEGALEVQVVGSDRSIERGSITIESPKDGIVGARVEVRGNTDAYINLKATDNDTMVWTGESDAEGKFSFSLTFADPSVPTHKIVVSEGEGGLGRVSKPLLLTIDTSAPQFRSDTLALLPGTVAPGDSFTVSITAEANHSVTASIASVQDLPLMEAKGEGGEEGLSVYSGTLTAPHEPGTYPVTISVHDSAGNTSRMTKILTVAAGSLPRVEGVQAQTLENGVQLVWLPVSGATSYRIYFGVQPHDLSRHLDTGSPSTAARLTGLSSGQTTYFAVTALDASGRESVGKSQLSSSQPRGSLFQTTVTPFINGARVEWVPQAADIVAYRIQYGVQSQTYTEQRLLDPRSTRFEIPDLINGVTYYVSLGALLRDGKLIQDTSEHSATPGEGGKPGMHLAPPDPLPEELSGVGGRGLVGREEEGRREDVVVRGTTTHPSAPQSGSRPPRVPRSGLPLWGGMTMLFLAGGIVLMAQTKRRQKEQRVLFQIQQRYQWWMSHQ